jgi:hypothetical protein
MTLPAILLALLFALLIGALYHLLRGGGIGYLLLFLGLSILGFGAGHLLSLWLNWDFLPLGQINAGLSSVGSVIFLIIGDWLSRIEARADKPQSKV